MSVLQRIAAIVFLILFGTTTNAKSGYFCDIKPAGTRGGFIQKQMVFVFEDGFVSAVVIDPMIMGIAKRPAAGRVRKTNRGELRVRWDLNDIPVMGSTTVNGSYSADFNPKTLGVVVRSSIGNDANFERGTGVCQLLDKRQLNQFIKR